MVSKFVLALLSNHITFYGMLGFTKKLNLQEARYLTRIQFPGGFVANTTRIYGARTYLRWWVDLIILYHLLGWLSLLVGGPVIIMGVVGRGFRLETNF